MKIKTIVFSVSAVVGLTMFITNPTEDKYANYAAEKLLVQVSTSQGIIEQFCQGNLWCKRGPEIVLRPIIKSITTQSDYKLFSIYTTEIPGVKVTTVGVFNTFIPVSGEIGWSQKFGLPSF